MKIQYQILFSIEVLNDYYSHGKWKEMGFIPLPETKKLLNESGFQIRQVQNQLLIITPVDEDLKPFKLPDLFEKFSFVLQPQTPNYINFTNLPVDASQLRCFHFYNLHGNTVNNVHHLTTSIANYSNAVTYNPGGFAKGADGKVYESIKINNGTQPPDDTIPASKDFWELHGDDQFVTIADSRQQEGTDVYDVKCVGPQFYFKTSVKKTAHHVEVYALDVLTGQYTKNVFNEVITSDALIDIVQVNMAKLTSGKYKVKVGDDIGYVYRIAESPDGVPMFIDIFNLPGADPRSFLNPDGTLKNSKYTIHFGSRRVFWRYKTRTNTIDKIDDTSGDHSFVADGIRFFISEKPIPLSDTPIKTLSANTGTLVITSPLPNPRVDRLLDKRDEIFTTETFINY